MKATFFLPPQGKTNPGWEVEPSGLQPQNLMEELPSGTAGPAPLRAAGWNPSGLAEPWPCVSAVTFLLALIEEDLPGCQTCGALPGSRRGPSLLLPVKGSMLLAAVSLEARLLL